MNKNRNKENKPGKNGIKVGSGAVICLASTYLPITEDMSIIPMSYL